MKYVQSSEEVPPFYKNAFERAGTNETLPDPVTVVREAGLQLRRPGLGPTDLLGFRNLAVPNTADVIAIGDSQTYGHGVEFEDSWPRQLEARLDAGVYSMACGGWGPTQYLAMARLAGKLRPKFVVVAYYTGNDPHDAFAEAYNKHRWRSLRVSTTLDKDDQPPAVWPVPEDDRWEAELRGGLRVGFTPGYRLANNDRSHPGVREGFAIIAKTGGLIAAALRESWGARPVFTVIPTKELVYARRVHAEGLRPPVDYRRLVADERANIDELAARLRQVPDAHYVDLVEPLQRAALGPEPLYPPDVNGHPTAAGYRVIAEAMAVDLAAIGAARLRAGGPGRAYRPAEPPPPPKLSR